MLNMAMVCLTMLIIFGVALFYYSVIKITPEESWATAIMSILILIYIAGLFGSTNWALIIIYVFSMLGVILGIIGIINKAEFSLKSFITPGILFVFFVLACALIAFDGMMITNWDELYQWGKAVDFMIEYDSLPQGAAFSGEELLLSTTTMFHYFIAKLSSMVEGVVTQSNYYVSNLVLWCSALILPFSGERWGAWKRVWLFGMLQILFVGMIFVQPYYNIYTDQPTAYWAGAMIAWIVLKKCTKKNVFLIPLVLINVGMMKSMVGPLFAMIVVIAALIVYCCSRQEQGLSLVPDNWRRALFSKKGIIGAGIVLSPIVFVVVWSVVSGENGLFRSNGGVVRPGEEDRFVLTLKSMVEKLFITVNGHDEHIYVSYILFAFVVLMFVCVLYPLIIERKFQYTYISLMKVYLFGFILYFFVMLFAYMTVFGYVDSVRAMSLNRYYSDYIMLGVIPVLLPLFLSNPTGIKQDVIMLKKGVVMVSFLLVIYGVSGYLLQNSIHMYALEKEDYAEREQFAKYTKKIRKLTDDNGKIYFVNQKKSGLFTLVADYEMEEQISRGGMCYKFREDTSEVIIGLSDRPIKQFSSILAEQGYKYLWIYSTDQYFNDNMQNLFDITEIENGDFYKVISCGDGNVELQYLDNVQ